MSKCLSHHASLFIKHLPLLNAHIISQYILANAIFLQDYLYYLSVFGICCAAYFNDVASDG